MSEKQTHKSASGKKIPKKKSNNACIKCKVSFDKIPRASYGKCRMCDTSPTGTWFLSYLTELDYIHNDDTVENGYVFGSSNNGFLGLPDGTSIYCHIDDNDKTLFHITYATVNLDELSDLENYDNWNYHPTCGKVDFNVNTILTVSNKKKGENGFSTHGMKL